MQGAINRTLLARWFWSLAGHLQCQQNSKTWGFCAVMLEIYGISASPECLSCFIVGLGMENIGGIFVVLICGLIVAIFMAMLEFLWSLRHSEQSEVGPGSVLRGQGVFIAVCGVSHPSHAPSLRSIPSFDTSNTGAGLVHWAGSKIHELLVHTERGCRDAPRDQSCAQHPGAFPGDGISTRSRLDLVLMWR